MKPTVLFLGLVIVLGLIGGIGLLAINKNSAIASPPAELRANDLDEIPVATSERALRDFVTYTSAEPVDHVGRAQLELNGEIFRVSAGTHVTVMGGGWTSVRVHIRDGAFAGEEGFVPPEWIFNGFR